MGKIYGNFKDGIFYHCAAIDKDFTSEEWYKYCDDTRYSDAIVATYFGFQWNAHDACRTSVPAAHLLASHIIAEAALHPSFDHRYHSLSSQAQQTPIETQKAPAL